MTHSLIRLLFAISGLYDFVIGLAFLFFGKEIFEAAGVPLPAVWAYLRFCALLLIIFGIMFFAIAYDPVANRNLIPFGMLLKLSYVGMVVYYWTMIKCPTLFQPFAVIDAVMLVLFLLSYLALPARRDAATS